mgnify:CR=1 FL=1
MTDMVNKFNKAKAAIDKSAGYKKGMAVFNLADAFGKRGVNVVNHQNEK